MRGFPVTLLLAVLAATTTLTASSEASVRIKDIATIGGMRDNQLVGYGLVVGLLGTGDTMRNAPFTEQSVQSMLDQDGGQRPQYSVAQPQRRGGDRHGQPSGARRSRHAARRDRLGARRFDFADGRNPDHDSPDGRRWADSCGSPGGRLGIRLRVGGQAETYTQGVPTAGRIANGAIVEREAPGSLGPSGALTLELRNPDFKTAVRITDAINAYTKSHFRVSAAQEQDLRRVALLCPPGVNTTRFMSDIGDLTVEPDTPARVVIDERTGTVVIGEDVQISTVAVTHGSLTVRITESPQVSQPQPLSGGKTAVVPSTAISSTEPKGTLEILHGTTLRTLVNGLNQIGLKPSGIIAILQAIKSAGALQADLVAQ